MKTGRNQPCPCGSGRKYKRCCFARDREEARAEEARAEEARDRRAARGTAGASAPPLTPEMQAAAAGRQVWQADIVPLRIAYEDDPSARPIAAAVVAGDLALHLDIESRLSAEVEPVARALELAFLAAAEAVGRLPSGLEVRHRVIAGDLADRLGPRGVDVTCSSRLADLDTFAMALSRDLTGYEGWPFVSSAVTWSAWGHGPSRTAELFTAAAAFWRAHPWTWITNLQLIEARIPEGGAWTACVMGNGGDEYGLALYSEREDLFRQIAAEPGDEEGVFARFVGRMVVVTFERRGVQPRAMQREVARMGWEVADPAAYPWLLLANTPAGGLTERDRADLVTLLGAIPRFVTAHQNDLEDVGAAAGRDAPTSVDMECALVGSVDVFDALSGLPPIADPLPDTDEWDADEWGAREPLWDAPQLWDAPRLLEPGGAAGPGAEPEAALEYFADAPSWDELRWFRAKDDRVRRSAAAARESVPAPESGLDEPPADTRALITRFVAFLRNEEGFGEDTVEKHAGNVAAFLACLDGAGRIPIRAVHEYDLRRFLYNVFPRFAWRSRTSARAMPTSLRRFFRWLAEGEGIECPWAKRVLGNREAFEVRLEAGESYPPWAGADPAWYEELYEDFAGRAFLPDSALFGGREWSDPREAGPLELRLSKELQRRWLLWREELVAGGLTHASDLFPALIARQREWERASHPHLDGLAPADMVEAEQRRLESGAPRFENLSLPL